jgi:hypothetical protein
MGVNLLLANVCSIVWTTSSGAPGSPVKPVGESLEFRLNSFGSTSLLSGVELVKSLDGSVDRHRLELIAAIDERETWRGDGSKNLTEWVSAHFQESHWTARRWIEAARALPLLARITKALSSGALPLAKVCELTRFATPQSEAGLIRWAQGVSASAIRRRAYRETVDPIEEVRADDDARSLSWWYEDDRRLHLEGLLPSEQGAQVVRALERLADRLPSDPEAERAYTLDQRRADALVALSSQAISDDPDSARARVNLHVDLAALVARDGSGTIECGGVVHPAVASMLCCDSIVQAIVHGDGGHTVGIGQAARTVPEWLYRQLRERDGGCTFPGCHHSRYVRAHHIWWWEWGGPTDLDNLVLVCDFHHKLIHLHGWRVELGKRAGVVYWFRPDYVPYTLCPPGGRDSEPFARRGAAELRRSPEVCPPRGRDSEPFARRGAAELRRSPEPNRAPPDGPEQDGLINPIEQRELVGA